VNRSPSPLLTVRAAITLLFSLVIGCGAGVLSFAGNHSAAAAVLVGAGAGGGAVVLLNNIIAGHDGNDAG
jgi:hypothetical protein